MTLHDRLEIMEEENRQLKDRIAELEGRSDYEAANEAFGLTRHETGLLLLLVRRGVASRELCIETLYGGRQGKWPDDPLNVVSVLMTKVRRKLVPHGIKITTVYGFGWHFNEPDRSRARKMLAVHETSTGSASGVPA